MLVITYIYYFSWDWFPVLCSGLLPQRIQEDFVERQALFLLIVLILSAFKLILWHVTLKFRPAVFRFSVLMTVVYNRTCVPHWVPHVDSYPIYIYTHICMFQQNVLLCCDGVRRRLWNSGHEMTRCPSPTWYMSDYGAAMEWYWQEKRALGMSDEWVGRKYLQVIDRVAGRRRKLHSENSINLYSLTNIIKVINWWCGRFM